MLRGSLTGTGMDAYPSQAEAAAIIKAMGTASGWPEVERMTGIDFAQYRANRCFMVYGSPELEPTALARWTAEASLRRWASTTTTTTTNPGATPTTTKTPRDPGYGFGRAD